MFDKLPGFLAEFADAETKTSRGKVGVEVVKNNGEAVGVMIKCQNVINFPQADSQQVLLALTQRVADLVKTARDKENVIIRLESKAGKITRMFITSEYYKDVAQND